MPTDLDALVVSGKGALETGDWSAARASFEAALEVGETAEALLGLGDALWWLGETRASIAYRERAFAAFVRRRVPVPVLRLPDPLRRRAVRDGQVDSGRTGAQDRDRALARRHTGALGERRPNASFELRDVSDLAEFDRFDLITAFDAVHDQAHPAQVLAGIATALRADGVFLMVDIRASSDLEDYVDHPLGTFLYTISTMHCMTVSLALDGDGLGTVWGEQQAQRMLAEAGFAAVETTNVEADVLNTYYIAGKTAAGF